MRPVSDRLNSRIETEMFVIANDTDYLARHALFFHVDRELFAEWVRAFEVLLHERFVNEYNVPHLRRLLLRVETTWLQRDRHCVEVVGAGGPRAGPQFLIGR